MSCILLCLLLWFHALEATNRYAVSTLYECMCSCLSCDFFHQHDCVLDTQKNVLMVSSNAINHGLIRKLSIYGRWTLFFFYFWHSVFFELGSD
jgi:hypothetical protein